MKTDNVLYWLIYFIVTVIIAWIAFSLILLWFRPALYNTDGSVNWWTTLWVAALIIIFAWIIMIILTFLLSLFRGNCGRVKDCDPCEKGYSYQPSPYDPRMWMY
jgi:hypothetical protein